MLVQADNNSSSCPSSGRSSLTPSRILQDSPTLARVERAMLRHSEDGTQASRRAALDLSAHRAIYTQSLITPSSGNKDNAFAPIKRGLLWQQRDKFFSRWKERYFILTKDYLHCFRRASGNDRISEMGQFLYKVKLVDVDRVLWENKKTYSTVVLVILVLAGRESLQSSAQHVRMYLRSTNGLEDWYEMLEECTHSSKERRMMFRTLAACNSPTGVPMGIGPGYQQPQRPLAMMNNNNADELYSVRGWPGMATSVDRPKIPLRRLHLDNASNTTREEVVRRRQPYPVDRDDRDSCAESTLDNRLSLLTDIDINSYMNATSTNGDTMTDSMRSVTSYRHNNDILCIQPPSLRESYRSAQGYHPHHPQHANLSSSQPRQQLQQAVGRQHQKQQPPPLPQRHLRQPSDASMVSSVAGQQSLIKYRERSYSDIQRVDKRQWNPRNYLD